VGRQKLRPDRRGGAGARGRGGAGAVLVLLVLTELGLRRVVATRPHYGHKVLVAHLACAPGVWGQTVPAHLQRQADRHRMRHF
jgi:hypothetical protein